MTNQGYQVIARRWRPKQFSELVGQDHIVRTLTNAIENDRIAHAYLFVGPRGTGKTSTARLFAKALNAEGGPKVEIDDSNEISQSIMNGSCMDVIEIDGASNNSVDQIRSLREECQYAPAQCTYKIYIIDEVHMLTTAAFNALLKTLEEPPAHVKFFFATTEAHKVLPTIVSRCQRFEFRPILESVITDKLTLISKAEGIEVEVEALKAVARLANGGMRDAQSILDQMISFCGKEIKESDVLNVYGLVGYEEVKALAQEMAGLEYTKLIDRVNGYVDQGSDLIRVHHDLTTYIREVLIDAIKNNGKTKCLGTEMTTASLMRMSEILQNGEASIRTGLSERSNFEIVILKAAEESRSLEIDSLIKTIVASEQNNEKKKAWISPSYPLNNDHKVTPNIGIKDLPFEAEKVPEEHDLFSNQIEDLGTEKEDVNENINTIDGVPPEIEMTSSSELEISDTLLENEMIELPPDTKVVELTLEEATKKIPKSVLEVLKKNFNGSPEECRKLRESDRIF